MVFAVLNSDGQLGFRDSESDSVVQTFAFEGGIIQLRYDLDGNREHRVFVDDAWTPWAKAGVTALQAGDGIDVTGSEDEPVIAVDDSVMRLDRAETVTGEKTVTTIKVTNSGSIAPSSDNGSFTVGSSASTRPNVQLSGPNNRGQLRVGTTVAATWTNSGLYAGDSTSQADFLATRGYVDDSAYTPGSGLSVTSGEISVDNTVVRTSRAVTAGSGLTGGGNLSADRTLSVDDTVIRRLGGRVESSSNMSYLEWRIQWGPADVPSYLLVGPLDTIGRSLAGSFYGARDASSGGVGGVTIDLNFKSGSSSNDFRASAVINYAGREEDTPVLNTATFDGQEWLAINFLQTGYYQPDRFFFRGLAQNVEILNAPATLVTNVQPYDGDGPLIFNNAEVVTTATRLQFRISTGNTTLELGDVDSVIEVNSADARTVTVPTNDSVPIPIGAVIEIMRYGGGAVTVSPQSGVALLSPDGETGARNIASQYGSAFLRKRSASQWHLTGDLE